GTEAASQRSRRLLRYLVAGLWSTSFRNWCRELACFFIGSTASRCAKASPSSRQTSLAEARETAREKLRLVGKLGTPGQEAARQKAAEAKRRAETFSNLADTYHVSHLAKLTSGEELWQRVKDDLFLLGPDIAPTSALAPSCRCSTRSRKPRGSMRAISG